ncbi:MAG TPA: DUF2244 domain-containing protein [Caulobacteraceae bacterium]|nr:DUF2244 domain-containing protein [Caulobacteraceae bacterium]
MIVGEMDGPLYMDAVITPHRSLSRRGFIVLISVLTFINVATAATFVALGAAPIPIFFGLDLAAVVVALFASRRAGEARERVQVTAAEVRVILETRHGVERVWTSPTAFTRVTLVAEADDGDDLLLGLSDREFAVARALRRGERLDFALALDRAILNARTDGRAG